METVNYNYFLFSFLAFFSSLLFLCFLIDKKCQTNYAGLLGTISLLCLRDGYISKRWLLLGHWRNEIYLDSCSIYIFLTLQPKYYDGSYNRMIEVLLQCKSTGCTFIVGGRNVDGVFKVSDSSNAGCVLTLIFSSRFAISRLNLAYISAGT